MTSQQFQRFLTWTSDNKDVIDQLQVRGRRVVASAVRVGAD